MKIVFIRHGATAGNLEKRYIGKTDEPLCDHGIRQIEIKKYPSVRRVISSPMKRCIQTAKLIYPSAKPIIFNDFRECDFGDFEGKNYAELNGDTDYQNWIDSGGKMTFPNGENPDEFKNRSICAFEKIAENTRPDCTASLVVHGGTIMAILEKFAVPKKEFYEFYARNGSGFITEFDGKKLKIIERI